MTRLVSIKTVWLTIILLKVSAAFNRTSFYIFIYLFQYKHYFQHKMQHYSIKVCLFETLRPGQQFFSHFGGVLDLTSIKQWG